MRIPIILVPRYRLKHGAKIAEVRAHDRDIAKRNIYIWLYFIDELSYVNALGGFCRQMSLLIRHLTTAAKGQRTGRAQLERFVISSSKANEVQIPVRSDWQY